MSANNTEINLNSSGYAEREFKGNTAVALNWPWDRQKRYRQSCSQHGSHETLSLDGFTVEYNGVEYAPRDDAALSYCPDCLGEFRSREIEFSDARDVDVIEELITSGRVWSREFRDGFEAAYLDTAGDLEYCPFCGESFETSNQHNGRATCPNHGPLKLDVQQLEG
jgi:hypothetical protein